MGGSADGVVDVKALERTVESVPAELVQPGEVFDPSPMVVEVLNTQAPRNALSALKERKRVLEEHVNAVAHGSADSFASSLSRYRDALASLHQGHAILSTTKQSLRSARSSLNPPTETLRSQWLHKLSLDEEINLLSRIASVARSPYDADVLASDLRLHDALLLLLDASSLPDDLASLPVLREPLSQLRSSFDSLRSSVLSRLQSHITTTTSSSSSFSSHSFASSRNQTPRPRSRSRRHLKRTSPPAFPSPPISTANGGESVDVHALSVRTWLSAHSDSFGSLGNDEEISSTFRSNEASKEMATLVSCLRQLDAIGAARSQVVRNTERNVHYVIRTSLDRFAQQQAPNTSSNEQAERLFGDIFGSTLQLVRNACSALESIIEEESRLPAGSEVDRHSASAKPYDDLLRVWDRVQDTLLEVLQGLLDVNTEKLTSVNTRSGLATTSFSLGFKGMDTVMVSEHAGTGSQQSHQSSASYLSPSGTSQKNASLISEIDSYVGSGHGLTPSLYRSLCEFVSDGQRVIQSIALSEPSRSLRDYIERFVSFIYLPLIWQKYQDRVSESVQQEETLGPTHDPSAMQTIDAERVTCYGLVIPPALKLGEASHELIITCKQLPTFADEILELLESLTSSVYDCICRLYKRVLKESLLSAAGYTVPKQGLDSVIGSEEQSAMHSATVLHSDSKSANVVVVAQQLTSLAITISSFKYLRACLHYDNHEVLLSGNNINEGYFTRDLAERGSACTHMASVAFNALQYEMLLQFATLFGPLLNENNALWQRSITLERFGRGISDLCERIESEVATCLEDDEQIQLIAPLPSAFRVLVSRVLRERHMSDNNAAVEPLLSTAERASLPLETLGGKGWSQNLRRALDDAKRST